MLGILDTLLGLKTFNELRTNATQEYARNVWRFQFPLDDVMHIDRERCQYDRTIKIAGMINGHDVGCLTRQMFKSLDDQRYARQPQ